MANTNYSPMEIKVMGYMKKFNPGRRFTISELMDHLYDKRRPLFARQSVRDLLVKRLNPKLEKAGDKYRIRSSPARGPHEVEYWRERVKP